ncbi:MAG: alpha-ketoglutarate-dependent dioxygenase AlkB [Gammaproteobacteria bacterium]|nr:alpha-ketoglutarate-dependent dioxygenase AlkB [Gammaproteobacteria bacterium]
MTQSDLFNDLQLQSVELIEIDDGDILWIKRFLPKADADLLLQTLQNEIPWRQDSIRIAGKDTPIPRLQAWYGDPGMTYTYSGLKLDPLPWTLTLAAIKQRIEDYSDCHFNSLLANLYRNEQDSVGWHADDEPELGQNPAIASLSLGDARDFQLKHRTHPEQKLSLPLQHGDLLIMKGALQHHWVHQIPKSKTPCQPRINLTFRRIFK